MNDQNTVDLELEQMGQQVNNGKLLSNNEVEIIASNAGAEVTIAQMDEYSRAEIGRKTYRFVRRCLQDPVLRERIKARAAELRAEKAGK